MKHHEMKVTVTILKIVIEVQSNPKQIKHAPYKVCMCQPSANIWFLQTYTCMYFHLRGSRA